jgi:hypothetical protein
VVRRARVWYFGNMPPSSRRLTALIFYTEDLDGIPVTLGQAALAHASLVRSERPRRLARDRRAACARHLATLAVELAAVGGRWAGAADPEVRITLPELADWHLDPDCIAWPRYPYLRHFIPFAELGNALASGPEYAVGVTLDAAAVRFSDWYKAACSAGGGSG